MDMNFLREPAIYYDAKKALEALEALKQTTPQEIIDALGGLTWRDLLLYSAGTIVGAEQAMINCSVS